MGLEPRWNEGHMLPRRLFVVVPDFGKVGVDHVVLGRRLLARSRLAPEDLPIAAAEPASCACTWPRQASSLTARVRWSST
jgi:hypothetical protein